MAADPDLAAREGTLTSRDGTRLSWRAWPVVDPTAVVEVFASPADSLG